MQQDEHVMAVTEKAAALMEQFERRCELIDQRLQETVRHLPALARQPCEELLQTLPDQLVDVTRARLGDSLDGYQRRLHAAGGDIAERAHVLAARIGQLERLHRRLVWKAAAVVWASLLLMLAGGLWLSMHYRQVIGQNQLSAQLLEAYNHADVSLCGSRLCANVDASGRRYGDRRQYVPIKPR